MKLKLAMVVRKRHEGSLSLEWLLGVFMAIVDMTKRDHLNFLRSQLIKVKIWQKPSKSS
jgi:hypothetical protein